jgi:hypothetical protein
MHVFAEIITRFFRPNCNRISGFKADQQNGRESVASIPCKYDRDEQAIKLD